MLNTLNTMIADFRIKWRSYQQLRRECNQKYDLYINSRRTIIWAGDENTAVRRACMVNMFRPVLRTIEGEFGDFMYSTVKYCPNFDEDVPCRNRACPLCRNNNSVFKLRDDWVQTRENCRKFWRNAEKQSVR